MCNFWECKASSNLGNQSVKSTIVQSKEKKTHMIISIDALKVFDKIQPTYMIKILANQELKGTSFTW